MTKSPKPADYRGEITRHGIASILLRLGGIALAFALNVFIARLLNVGGYGRYVYVINIANILVVPCLLGLQQTRVRYVPHYLEQGKSNLIKGLVAFSRLLVFTASVIAAIVLLFVTLLLIDSDNALYSALLFIPILLPFQALMELENAGLRSFKLIVAARLPVQVVRPLLIVLLIVGYVWITSARPDVQTVLLSTIAATVLTLLLLWAFMNRRMGDLRSDSIAQYRPKEWIRTSLYLWLIGGFGLFLNYIDVLMVGGMMTTDDAGIYFAAVKISTLIGVGITAMNIVVAPQISQYYSAGKKSDLQGVITFSTRIIFALTLPAVLIVVFMGEWILSFFGPAFTSAYPALVVLAIGQLVSAIAGNVGYITTMTGQERISSAILGVSVVLNLVLNYIFIQNFGIFGAALATTITTALWNVALVVFVRKVLKLKSTIV